MTFWEWGIGRAFEQLEPNRMSLCLYYACLTAYGSLMVPPLCEVTWGMQPHSH